MSLHDETYIADWVVKSAIAGCPVMPNKLLNAVKLVLDRQGLTTQFKNNRPTPSWVRRFRLRHDIARRTLEAIPTAEHTPLSSPLPSTSNVLELASPMVPGTPNPVDPAEVIITIFKHY